VVAESGAVRAQIGLTGQFAAVDDDLSGRENLEFIGRLCQLSHGDARARAAELLERFELTDAADRRVSGYSGGMVRRLDLALSLVGRPRVVFLDEPTTGLDPSSRLALWEAIRELVAAGTTILLTTQYLEEADRLADRVAVIARGRLIASGTLGELKDAVGGQVLELGFSSAVEAGLAAEALRDVGDRSPELRDGELDGRVVLPIGEDTARVAEAVRRLDGAGVAVCDLQLQRPTLEDVFFALTGDAPPPAPDGNPGSGARDDER
jgi:ABC-2 type transport system ATP-binding protein